MFRVNLKNWAFILKLKLLLRYHVRIYELVRVFSIYMDIYAKGCTLHNKQTHLFFFFVPRNYHQLKYDEFLLLVNEFQQQNKHQ